MKLSLICIAAAVCLAQGAKYEGRGRRTQHHRRVLKNSKRTFTSIWAERTPAPTAAPSDMPSDVPSAVPTLVLNVQAISANAPPSDAPSDVPSDTPSDVPSAVPTLPMNVQPLSDKAPPSDAPSDVPSDTPSDVPSAVPTYAAKETRQENMLVAMSDVPSDVPSDTPSDVPSAVPTYATEASLSDKSIEQKAPPSDAPSDVPSDVPSSVPTYATKATFGDQSVEQGAPSDTPSDVPSALPTSSFGSDVEVSNVPDGYRTCDAAIAAKTDFESLSDVTVTYLYRIQLEEGADPTATTHSMNSRLVEDAADNLCEDTAILALSTAESDLATALCGDDCFYMLGRLTVKTDSEQNPSCSMASVLKVFFAEMATFPGAVSVKLTDNFAEDFDCATDDDDEEEEDSSSVADASRTSGERTSATSDKETPSVAGLASISMAAGALVAVAMVGVYLQRRRQQQQEEHRVRVARMGAAPSLMDVESSMYD